MNPLNVAGLGATETYYCQAAGLRSEERRIAHENGPCSCAHADALSRQQLILRLAGHSAGVGRGHDQAGGVATRPRSGDGMSKAKGGSVAMHLRTAHGKLEKQARGGQKEVGHARGERWLNPCLALAKPPPAEPLSKC